MSTSQSSPDRLAAAPDLAEAPASLAPLAARRRLLDRPAVLAGGGLVIVAAATALVIWLWHVKGQSTLAASVGAITPDVDPPVAAPPVKELAKPTSNPLPPRPSLAKRLDAVVQLAAQIPNTESRTIANERIQRWEIRFPNGNTAETYARQLDLLNIELGVLGGGERIDYASGFTKEVPDRRDGPAADEQRFYMTWRSGAMRDLDSGLLSRAKISAAGRIIAQFYPPQLEKTLADLEKQFAAPRTVAEVRHTVFALEPTDKAYEFSVAEQEYVNGEVKRGEQKPAAAKPEAGKPPVQPDAPKDAPKRDGNRPPAGNPNLPVPIPPPR